MSINFFEKLNIEKISNLITYLEMYLQKNEKKCILLIIFLTILWESFLVQDMNFFWEDGTTHRFLSRVKIADAVVVAIVNTSINYAAQPIAKDILKQFLTNIDATTRISGLNVNYISIYQLAGAVFKTNIVLYRVTGILLVTILPVLLFLLFIKLKRMLLGITAVIMYLFFPQLWQMSLGTGLPTLMTHLATVSALFIFYCYYQNSKGTLKTILLAFLIFFLTRFSILLKEEGRIVFVIIFLYLLITNFKAILQPKNVFLLFLLFSIAYPFNSGLQSFTYYKTNASIIDLVSTFVSRSNVLLFVFGKINLLICGLVIIGLIAFLIKLNKTADNETTSLFRLTTFSFIWLSNSIMFPFLGKGFEPVTEKSWWQVDFLFSIFPFVLLIFAGILFLSKLIHKDYLKKSYLASISILILISFIMQAITFNGFVGGLRDYYIGYDTAREMIDNLYFKEKAVLISLGDVIGMPQTVSSLNYLIAMNSDTMSNITILKAIQNNHPHIYVAANQELLIISNITKNTTIIVPRENSVYESIKKIIRGPKTARYYLYEIKDLNAQKNEYHSALKHNSIKS